MGAGAVVPREALARPGREGLEEPVVTRTVSSLIGGRPVEGATGGTLEVADPAHLSDVVAQASLGDASTFVEASRVARRAQRAWAEVPAPVRGRALHHLGRLVEDNKEALATLLTRE